MALLELKKAVWEHYRKHKRDMPWRRTQDPYKILVSEIMLQQTQVSRVEGYYERFLRRFPDFKTLARAKTADVLREWQGLGYNRRALNLQKLSRIVLERFNGKLPKTREELEELPGIGKGTSGALMAFAFNKPEVFIETNIRRVFIHFLFPKKRGVTDADLERYIKSTIDAKNPREWYWALMDYGAAMGSNKSSEGRGGQNPNRRSAHYKRPSAFSGSNRELRGNIVRIMLEKQKITERSLQKVINAPGAKIKEAITGLRREGFIKKNGKHLSLNEN